MKKKSSGLVRRLTRMVSVLLLITTIIVCVFFVIITSQRFTRQTREEHSFTIDQINGNIEQTLVEATTVFDRLFMSLNLPYLLDDNIQLTSSELDYFIHNVQTQMVSNRVRYDGKFSNISIFSTNNQIKDTANFYWSSTITELLNSPHYAEILDSEELTVIGSAQRHYLQLNDIEQVNNSLDTNIHETDVWRIPIYRKVYSHNPRRLVGAIKIDVDIQQVVDLEEIMKLPVSDNQVIILLDADYQVLYDNLSLNLNDKQSISDTLISAMSGEKSEVHSEPLLETVYPNINVVSGVSDIRLELTNGNFIISAEKELQTGFIIAVATSATTLMSNIIFQIVLIMLAAFVFWGILVSITYRFVNKTLSRLVILDRVMTRVGEGDFTIELTHDKYEDEVTSIRNSFNMMTSQLKQVLEEKVQNEQAQKNAELKALQAQINPHFLYNTLEGMRMQCEIDEYYELGDSLSALSNLFHYSIRWGNNEAPLQMEWENLENYLGIMNMRFGDDIETQLFCDENIGQIIVPKMLLQPLVENSFNHGFDGKLPPWKLEVTIQQVQNLIRIVIQDNGVGISPERLCYINECLENNAVIFNEKRDKESIGVLNVKQRIAMICKEGSRLQIESEVGQGTKVTVDIVLDEI